jgi:CMP-2-keto-3-deoxyoctulosonic acid synthetase
MKFIACIPARYGSSRLCGKPLYEINNKPISENTILKYLREITNTTQINIDMLRSAYITNFYNNNMTFNERETLSHKMRHSQATASKNYLKVSNIEKITPNEKIKELSKQNIILNKLISECNIKIKALEKTPENEKEYTKKRNDIIYLLNKGRASKPETITKYKILHDDKTNKYY